MLGVGGEMRDLEQCDDVLRDASDNQMDILGTLKFWCMYVGQVSGFAIIFEY